MSQNRHNTQNCVVYQIQIVTGWSVRAIFKMIRKCVLHFRKKQAFKVNYGHSIRKAMKFVAYLRLCNICNKRKSKMICLWNGWCICMLCAPVGCNRIPFSSMKVIRLFYYAARFVSLHNSHARIQFISTCFTSIAHDDCKETRRIKFVWNIYLKMYLKMECYKWKWESPT